MKKSIVELALSFSIYFLLLIAYGYEQWGSDMIEVIPYLKKWDNPQLYPNDFYLNYIFQLPFFERSVYLALLHYTVSHHQLGLFIVHLICSVSLILATIKIISYFVKEVAWTYLTCLSFFLLCSWFSLNGHEMYYNMPVSSMVALSLASWAMYFFFSSKLSLQIIFAVLTCYIHAIVGLHLFGLILLFYISRSFVLHRFLCKEILRFGMGWLIFCAPYLLFLVWKTASVHSHGNLEQELLEFRIGHHLYFHYQDIQNIVLSFLLFGLGLWSSSKTERWIFLYLIFHGLFILVYGMLTSIFHVGWVTKTMWLGSSIFLELFCVISVFMFFKNYFVAQYYRIKKVFYVLVCCGLVAAISYKNFYTSRGELIQADELELAQFCKLNTSNDALFATPMNFTRFKALSERSSWVDWKAIGHHLAYLAPWSDRIQKLYGVNFSDRKSNHEWNTKANLFYNNLSENELKELFSKYGIGFYIRDKRFSKQPFSMQPLFENTTYQLYTLK
ncbi:MAG TPA: hypothetical protein PK006_01780 [Saprospiraceae bacterium]|nr:hypothetical protein [Saprospiraceae bacterium]